MAKKSDEQEESWARPQPPSLVKDKDSLTFQKLDIREGQTTSGESEIHLIGLTRGGHSILVHVLDFHHYFYYPAPNFTDDDLQPFRRHLNTLVPTSAQWLTNLDIEKVAAALNGPPLTFLKFFVSDHRKIQQLRGVLLSGKCQYGDHFTEPQSSYEGKVPYRLRFMIDNEIECMNLLKIPAGKYDLVSADSKVSTCQAEVTTSYEDLLICDIADNRQKYVPLRILSFDLECNVPARGDFPNACNDPIFQIASMVSYYGQSTPFIRVVFTVGSCAPISGTEVKCYKSEADMLHAWQEFFTEVDPDVVTGYNITQFDIPFMLKRAQILRLDSFPFLGRIKSSPQCVGPNPPGGWRATFENCPGYDGRLLLDVFHYIKAYYPNRNKAGGYKLDAVSLDFLGQRKEDIHFSQISVLQNGDAETRRDLAVYCLKDTYLPLLLLDKLKCLEKEIEASREAHVPFNSMRTDHGLKCLSKRCQAAVEKGYVAIDH